MWPRSIVKNDPLIFDSLPLLTLQTQQCSFSPLLFPDNIGNCVLTSYFFRNSFFGIARLCGHLEPAASLPRKNSPGLASVCSARLVVQRRHCSSFLASLKEEQAFCFLASVHINGGISSHFGVTVEVTPIRLRAVAEAYGSRTHQGPRRATPQPF